MDNCVRVTKKLLDSIHVSNTSTFIYDCILSHPDHSSLLAITDTLDKYAIHHLALKIDFEKLQQIPMPCIVQVSIDRNPHFVVLNSISKNEVSYFDDRNKLIVQSKQDFMAAWSGICLAVEGTADSKEPHIEEKLAAKRTLNILKANLVVLVMGWILLGFINSEVAGSNSSYIAFSIVYTILKLIGLSVGIALLWFEVDKYNPVLQSFCTGGNKKINCNAVLDSKQASLFNDTISLSLLGFSYFFGTLSYIVISGFSFAAFSVLGMLSYITLPIILTSIYYQAVVLKQWCKFCIILQAVLLAEIGIAYFSGINVMAIAPENLFLLLALLLIPILGWKMIKPLLEREKEMNVHKRALKKIKNNPNVLDGLLVNSKQIKTSVKGLGITLFNDTAKYQIIKVCNPYCGPCAKAHPVLEGLLNAGKINLQILFTARANGKDAKAKPVSHFLAIDELGDRSRTQQALDDWYHAEKKDYETFATKYPMNGELKKQNTKIEAMRQWCDAENITHTPTIFINGYELPREYSIEDLKEVLQ